MGVLLFKLLTALSIYWTNTLDTVLVRLYKSSLGKAKSVNLFFTVTYTDRSVTVTLVF